MRTVSSKHRVIARDQNVLQLSFERDPEPPAPHFPGAGALRGWLQPWQAEDFSSGGIEGRAA
jgi:hypothetical protein